MRRASVQRSLRPNESAPTRAGFRRMRIGQANQLVLNGKFAEKIARRVVMADEIPRQPRVDPARKLTRAGRVPFEQVDERQPPRMEKVDQRRVESLAWLDPARRR